MGKNTMENIKDLCQAMCDLPEDEFHDAVASVALLTMNTMIVSHGREFADNFLVQALSEEGNMPVLKCNNNR